MARRGMEDGAVGGVITRSASRRLKQQPQPRTNYRYIPLGSPSHFRTIEIKPGHYEDDIKCSLHEGFPGDGTVYYALSYVWDPPVFSHQIYCDGGTLSITGSLYSALRNYRQADQSVTMWADAICINQEDLAERSQQVLLMQEIYSKSAQMRIWLGGESKFCSEAFRYMSDVLDIFGFPPEPDTEDEEQNTAVRDMKAAACDRSTEESLAGLDELFHNPWFRWAWTFQELICGSNAEISIGRLTVALDTVSDWVIIVQALSRPNLQSFMDWH